jgi:hypothetical protein
MSDLGVRMVKSGIPLRHRPGGDCMKVQLNPLPHLA